MDEVSIDVAQFLGAIIDDQGGEIRVPYAVLERMEGDKNIAVDMEEHDGVDYLVFRLVDVEDVVYSDE